MILQLEPDVTYEVCVLCEGEGCPLCEGLGAVEHTCAAERLREEMQRYGDDLRELADEETDGDN